VGEAGGDTGTCWVAWVPEAPRGRDRQGDKSLPSGWGHVTSSQRGHEPDLPGPCVPKTKGLGPGSSLLPFLDRRSQELGNEPTTNHRSNGMLGTVTRGSWSHRDSEQTGWGGRQVWGKGQPGGIQQAVSWLAKCRALETACTQRGRIYHC
jgi:hypothetical protein